MDLLVKILIVLISTKLAGDLSARCGQPTVLGKLLVGVLIGPALLGWIDNSHLIRELSEIGVLLLMFLAGLETNIVQLNKNRKSSAAVALGGIIFPLAGGYIIGTIFNMNHLSALFLGLILSATSVSITVQTLREVGKLKTREGTTILGAAIVDDVLVVVLLAVLGSFTGIDDTSMTLIIGKKLLFFILVILAGWKLVPWVMRFLSSLRTSETVISAALILCLGFSYFAEKMGVAGIIGAFIAGLSISETPYKQTVEKKLAPIAFSIFVPFFFVSIGLSVTLKGITNQLWFILALTMVAIVTKLIGSGLGARLTGFNMSSSVVIGAGMISRGEVALIITTIGLQSHLLVEAYYTPILMVVILTTLMTPPLLKRLVKNI